MGELYNINLTLKQMDEFLTFIETLQDNDIFIPQSMEIIIIKVIEQYNVGILNDSF